MPLGWFTLHRFASAGRVLLPVFAHVPASCMRVLPFSPDWPSLVLQHGWRQP